MSRDDIIKRVSNHVKDAVCEDLGLFYDPAKFTIDSVQDVCADDFVIFEQPVFPYFEYANKPKPLGTRRICGRVIQESYGADKQ